MTLCSWNDDSLLCKRLNSLRGEKNRQPRMKHR